MEKYLAILGLKVRDKVTGFTGVATSVSFDLYGCVQVAVSQGLNKEGRLGDQFWFDEKRLETLTKKPVMEVPSFEAPPGPSDKPLQRQI